MDNQVVASFSSFSLFHHAPPQFDDKIKEGQKKKEDNKKMCAFISVAASSYRTDDVAILRSFVICRAELTLQQMPTVALI